MEFNGKLSTYESLKEGIRGSLQQMSKEFIVIGFYLKRIRNEELYTQDGYSSLWEFALETYGISTSTCSRWMAMNDKFSENGNSPMLAGEYKEFGKSQLQEMLYLSDEQLEQADPDMSAKEIRKIRKPEPDPESMQVAEVELKKPNVDEERYLEAFAKYLIEVKYDWMREDYHKRVMDVTSSPEELKEHLGRDSRSWYFDAGDNNAAHINLFDDYVQVWNGAGEYLGDFDWFYLAREIQSTWNVVALEKAKACNVVQPEDEHSISYFVLNYCEKNPITLKAILAICKEHKTNGERAKAIQKHVGLSGGADNEFGYTFSGYADGVEFKTDDQTIHLTYIQFVKEVEELYGPFSEPESAPVAPAQIAESRVKEPEIIDAEYQEVSEEYTPEQLLQEKRKELDEYLAVEGLPDRLLARQKIMVEALTLLVQARREIPEIEQTELPKLKNNDQRKDWLRNYKDWGIWYQDENIGATYYKYDFEDGTRLIAEEYPSQYYDYSSHLHLVGGQAERTKDKYGISKYPYHEFYTKYPDSESEVVEFLKYIQKGRQRNG